MTTPQIVTTIAALRARIAADRHQGAKIALVPTMGALHEGHLSLARLAHSLADEVVVSIFVNPTQFAPHEDFDRYPRVLQADVEKLGNDNHADVVFAPTIQEIYPAGFATRIVMNGPAEGLESDFRPHFFAGVTIIVAKLLLAALPEIAIFGEKDYQQLLVIRRLVSDLGIPANIIGAPILRESDGLAMSSRNAYLSPEERKVAGKLNVIVSGLCARLRAGETIPAVEKSGAHAVLDAGFSSVDYIAVRDAATLAPITSLDAPARVLAAATLGKTRLIDNMAVT
ncbi:MAG: pantoate--beta-alanine ligase [Alphaproteobacteria bacterium]|nr:pantoate--beta-alanine ligase [Alphaproteobacteria bacterium]